MAPEPEPLLLSEPIGDAGLCAPFVAVLPIDYASISIFGVGRAQPTISATNRIASDGDALQFRLGEGPNRDALRSGLPVLCPDLALTGSERWPAYAGAALDLGVAAQFAFPMNIGAATVGVVDLYSATTGRLAVQQITLAALMANRIALSAAHLALRSAVGADDGGPDSIRSLRREVHQATGMIQAQLDIPATDALAELRAHAVSSGHSIDLVAHDVVNRSLDFSALPR